MIYVIKENGYGYREKIVCAVSDEKTAKRYCRDMRTGRELFYEAVDLDAVTMDEISAEKIYVVERRAPWKANKDVPVTEMYKELMNVDLNEDSMELWSGQKYSKVKNSKIRPHGVMIFKL